MMTCVPGSTFVTNTAVLRGTFVALFAGNTVMVSGSQVHASARPGASATAANHRHAATAHCLSITSSVHDFVDQLCGVRHDTARKSQLTRTGMQAPACSSWLSCRHV